MTKYIVCFLVVFSAAFLVTGCSKDTEGNNNITPSFEVTCPETGNLAWEGTVFTVSVESNVEWTVESNAAWCRVTGNAGGDSNSEISVEILENQTMEKRETSLVFKWGNEGDYKEVVLVQAAQEFQEGGIYRIPVVFQMLYGNMSDKNQYIEEGHLQTVLDGVNKLYRESGQNLNLEFVMANLTPDGEIMEEPGVNRIEWTSSSIDCEEFMQSDEQRFLDIIWDPYKYINVVLYNFTKPSILGISQFPFVMAPDELIGVDSFEGGLPSQADLDRPQCVSINNKYIYDTGVVASPENPDGTLSNVICTLAHELGHYLGLRHAFSETLTDECVDSDYCDDTPTYNRQNYERLVQVYGSNYKSHLDELIRRESCISGESFVSTNIMDYSISYSNKFSTQQAARVRYILEHGVYIPGPKDYPEISKSRAASKAELPFEVIK